MSIWMQYARFLTDLFALNQSLRRKLVLTGARFATTAGGWLVTETTSTPAPVNASHLMQYINFRGRHSAPRKFRDRRLSCTSFDVLLNDYSATTNQALCLSALFERIVHLRLKNAIISLFSKSYIYSWREASLRYQTSAKPFIQSLNER